MALGFCDVEHVVLEGPQRTRAVGPVWRHHDMAGRAGHVPAAFTHHAGNAARQLMLDVAKMFVVDPPEREQSHYASFLPNFKHADASILTVQHMLQENISATYTLAGLAQAAAMSERSFLRRFKKATGLSPVAYIQSLRVEAARSRLELTKVSFERLSWDLGYNDSATFRSVFKRITGLSPSDYRRKFGAGGPASQL